MVAGILRWPERRESGAVARRVGRAGTVLPSKRSWRAGQAQSFRPIHRGDDLPWESSHLTTSA